MRSALFLAFFLLASIFPLAQQPKADEHLYRLTDKGVKPPQAIFTPAPEVTQKGRKIKSTSIAIVAGYVGIDGLFHGAKVVRSSGDSTLDAKAVDQLKTWKFHPCTKEGKPVNCVMDIEVEFKLYRDGNSPPAAP